MLHTLCTVLGMYCTDPKSNPKFARVGDSDRRWVLGQAGDWRMKHANSPNRLRQARLRNTVEGLGPFFLVHTVLCTAYGVHS